MGASMAARLLAAGFTPLRVNNRTKSKAEPLLALGAEWTESVAEIGQNSDVVFLMAGFPEEIEKIVCGDINSSGLLNVMAPGGIIVDMSTGRPDMSAEIGKKAAEKGLYFLDAPVSGGDIGAKNGTLSIMIGGVAEIVDKLSDHWKAMGKKFVHHGPNGSGQNAKMVNQILVAAHMAGLCESLIYAYRSGLDPVKVLESVSGGAAGSWAVENMAPRMMKGDFKPGFFIEHLIKDIGIALEEAKKMNISLPALSLFHRLYIMSDAQGRAKDGTQALLLTLAEINRIDISDKFR